MQHLDALLIYYSSASDAWNIKAVTIIPFNQEPPAQLTGQWLSPSMYRLHLDLELLVFIQSRIMASAPTARPTTCRRWHVLRLGIQRSPRLFYLPTPTLLSSISLAQEKMALMVVPEELDLAGHSSSPSNRMPPPQGQGVARG